MTFDCIAPALRLARRLSAVAAAAGLMLASTPGESLAQAPQPAGTEFRVNSHTTSFQGAPSVAMAADGNFLVVWSSGFSNVAASQDGSFEGVFAQRYNASGVAQSGEFRVNTITNSTQNQPSVAVDANGNFVVAFMGVNHPGGAGADIHVRRYNAAGTAQGGEFRVNSYTLNEQDAPSIAADAAGNFVVTWQSWFHDGDGSGWGIYGQRFNAAGVVQGAEFQANTTTIFDQRAPKVAKAPGGEFVVVWESDSQDGSGFALIGRRYTAAGVVQGGEFQVNTQTTGRQEEAAVAMDASGNFVVVWQTNHGGDDDIYARRYNNAGVPQGAEFRINTYTIGVQSLPSVSFDSTGGFLITWQSQNQDGAGSGVYAQRFSAAGAAIGGEFRVNTTLAADQSNPVVGAGNGVAVVVWQSQLQDGSDSGVYAQRYTFSTPQPPGSVQFSASTYQVGENVGPATITVRRTGGSSGGISVSYATSDGTATAGSDYTTASGTITFADGDTADKTFTVAITNDAVEEADETVNLTLNNPTAGATLGSPTTAVLTITNDDVAPPPPPPPAIGEYRANTYTTGFQGAPAVAMAPDNAFVVVWTSGVGNVAASQDGSFEGVFAQRYGADGSTQGFEFRVNTITTSTQNQPSVAVDAGGNFVVAFMGINHPGGAGEDIHVQRYNAAGVAQGGEFRVNSYTGNEQNAPSIAADAAGNFVVTWHSWFHDGDGSGWGIYGQRFNAAGVAEGAEFQANTTTIFDQRAPRVANAPGGEFVIVWESENQDGPGAAVIGRRYNAAGVAQGGEFQVNTQTTGRQEEAAVAMDASGNFVVVWQTNHAVDYDIYARRYSSAGAPQGAEFRINTYTTGVQSLPSISFDSTGGFLITWQSQNQDGAGSGVYAQRFSAAGAAIGGEFRVNTTLAADQSNPVVGAANGVAVVVWQSQVQDGSDSGVYAQRYTLSTPQPAGTIQFSASAYSVGENVGPATITVTRTGGSTGSISVSYATSNDTATAGLDYTATSGTITFADGDTAARIFTVAITNDSTQESNETIDLALSNPTGGATLGTPDAAVLTINDDDAPPPGPPGQLQFSAASYAPGEAEPPLLLTVTRTAGSSGTVTVSYATSSGTATSVADFTPATGTLTFANGETSRTIAVTILDDSVDEPDEAFSIALSNPGGGATLGSPSTATVTITDNDDPIPNSAGPFYLAEGATGPFFDLELAVANPNSVPAPIRASFLKEDGSTVVREMILLPTSRTTIKVNDIAELAQAGLSTVVESLNGLTLVVERTMFWDRVGPYYGGHTERAGEGARRQWFFAEGSQGFFDTYLLLANPQPRTNTATVSFLTETRGVVTRTIPLPPTSRTTLHTGSGNLTELIGQSFGITVSFAEPGAAERAMYFGTVPLWNGGHASAGVTAPATNWYHAEGATGSYFDTFILVANPNPSTATVTFTFLLDTGVVITKTKTIPANTRLTVAVESEDPQLANAAVSTQVSSDLPVVSERAMYWPGGFTSWFEAHNSFGLTAIGPKWGIAEGRVGGPLGFETYILLANPNAAAVDVKITFLRTDGTTVVKTYSVPPTSRFNVYVNGVPELSNESFGAVIEATAPIAVERAMYWNAQGFVWAGGTNAGGTRLP